MWDKRKADASFIRYLPRVRDKEKYLILFQKKAYASPTYTDKKTLEFTVELAANTYTNYRMMTIVLPIYFNKSTDKKVDVDAVTVNNFFACWLKEIYIRRYPDDVRILPKNNTVEFYNYTTQQIKHIPTKSLDDRKETIIYE